MLYYLSLLEGHLSELRLFQYITFRTLGAASTAFVLSLLLGPWVIRTLRQINVREQKTDARISKLEQEKVSKVDTPTMGGVLIILSSTIATLLWAEPTNPYVLLTLGTFVLMGVIGFIDDLLKIKRRNGLSVQMKFAAQLAWAAIVFGVLWALPEMRERLTDFMVPFFKNPLFQMAMVPAFIFMFLVLVGASNAVNLTDGLDGLAIGGIGWCQDPYTTPSTLRWARKGDDDFQDAELEGSWFPDAFGGTMAELLDAVDRGREPDFSGRDNLHTLALIDAAERSRQEKRAVALDEVPVG